ADVKSVMSGAGSALMGIGHARGDDRSVAAAEMAVSSPLLEASIDGAHGVLLSIAGGSDLGLFEINEAAQLVSMAAAPDANIIFGTVIDDALGDEVRVTVIAAGFDELPPPDKQLPRPQSRPAAGSGASGSGGPASVPPSGLRSSTPAPPKPEPARAEPRTDFRPEPRTDFRPEPRAETPKPEPARAEPRNDFRPEPRTDFRSEPRTDFRPEPRTEPRAEAPRPEPRPEPVRPVEPAPEPAQASAADETPADGPSGPVSIPRPAPEPANPPTPITSRMSEPGKRRPVVFEEQEEELDVPDFLK